MAILLLPMCADQHATLSAARALVPPPILSTPPMHRMPTMPYDAICLVTTYYILSEFFTLKTTISVHRHGADMVNLKTGGRLARKLGANIASRRKARKWSQAELAERLGVAPETISRFERGATLPSLMTLHRIGQVLKSSMAELIAESSPAPDDQAAVM